jgi:hypothetical protein
MVHHWQEENGRLEGDIPNIGGEIEDEANAKAGAFLKKFSEKYSVDKHYDIYSDEFLEDYIENFINQKFSLIFEDLNDPKKNWKSWKNDTDWSKKEKKTSAVRETEKIIKRWNNLATGKTKDPNFTSKNKEPLSQLNEKMKLDDFISCLDSLDEIITTSFEYTGEGGFVGKLKKQKKSNIKGKRVDRGSKGSIRERKMSIIEQYRRSKQAKSGNFKSKMNGKSLLVKAKKVLNAKNNPFHKS